jgi:hypothetical protein
MLPVTAYNMRSEQTVGIFLLGMLLRMQGTA